MMGNLFENIDEPLFENAHQALTFAYNYSNQQFAKSVMTILMGNGMRLPTGKGLSGTNGAGQAGMVMARVESLDDRMERHCLVARYARYPRECAHCGCSSPTPDWREAIAGLTTHALSAVSGISHLHLRRSLVERYFGTKIDMAETAKRFGVHRNTVTTQYRNIAAKFKKLEDGAMRNIEATLQESSLLAKTS